MADFKEKKKPRIDRVACAGCSVCVEVCPFNCLSIEDPRFLGDINAVAARDADTGCTGCGLCAKACPIGAIEMKTAGDHPAE